MEYKDYYKIMGVDRDATQEDIKRAYRKLARKYHPDVSKEESAQAKFQEMQEAYEVLRDPEKRAAYDRLGAGWQAGQDFRPPPDWDAGFEFSGDFGGAGESVFSDFFESLFGQHGRTRHRTFPARWPLLRLDRIYCRPAQALIRSWIDPAACDASDHLPVIADIRLPTPAAS